MTSASITHLHHSYHRFRMTNTQSTPHTIRHTTFRSYHKPPIILTSTPTSDSHKPPYPKLSIQNPFPKSTPKTRQQKHIRHHQKPVHKKGVATTTPIQSKKKKSFKYSEGQIHTVVPNQNPFSPYFWQCHLSHRS